MNKPQLTYPAIQAGQHLLVETRPAQLKEWLEALPYGDMNRALPEVAQAIASLNRCTLKDSQRVELVPLFDEVYQLISKHFRSQVQKKTEATSKLQSPHESQIQLFTREMAFAYKMLVDSQLERKSLFSRKSSLGRNINRAMHYLSLILMEHYENYAPIPVYIWRELNSLLGYAESNGLHQQTVSKSGQLMPTIEYTYLRTCMMALVNPYHLDRGEHWEIFNYLSHNCDALALDSTEGHELHGEKSFVVDLSSSNKPEYTDDTDAAELAEQHRLIISSPLCERIKQQQTLLKERIPVQNLGFSSTLTVEHAARLFERMLAHWSYRVERSSRRYPLITRVDVVWGMENIHAVFSAEDPFSQQGLLANKTGIKEVLPDTYTPKINWDALNVSDGGICLVNNQQQVTDLRVGEIAAIREYIDGQPTEEWRLGICRWLHGDKRQGTRLGIQFMKGRYQPAAVQLTQQEHISKKTHKAMIITGEEIHGLNSPTLVSPKGLYKDGRAMVVEVGDAVLNVRARMRVESTPTIERYFYQISDLSEDEPVEDAWGSAGDSISLDATPLPKRR